MFHYEFVKREWIVSAQARRVYRLSATVSVLLFILLLFMIYERAFGVVIPRVKLLFFAGALGAGTTIVAMEIFLFRFDQSHPLKQIVWFFVMLLPLLGPALYCFVVYSRSDIVKQSPPQSDAALPPT